MPEGPQRDCCGPSGMSAASGAPVALKGPRTPQGWPEPGSSGHPGGTFLLRLEAAQLSSWETARRASASRTPQLISCSVRTEGDWS